MRAQRCEVLNSRSGQREDLGAGAAGSLFCISMPLRIFQVDAFTDRPFAGNPAAVCILPKPRSARWMQKVAREMNLSETAFLVRRRGGFALRWFTPTVEVDLCGHATLASAHILWQERHLRPDQEARFFTRSGLLTARRRGAWIELDFPAEPVRRGRAPRRLMEALGITPVYVGRNRFDYLVELKNEAAVRRLSPDLSLLKIVGARGVMVTGRASSPRFDFVCRFFGPSVGIDEDPVTGSAFCALAPFWAKRLGKESMLAYQASARGGVVRCAVRGDRVLIAGKAVTTLRAELLV